MRVSHILSTADHGINIQGQEYNTEGAIYKVHFTRYHVRGVLLERVNIWNVACLPYLISYHRPFSTRNFNFY